MYWRKPLDQNQIKVPYGVIHIIEERCKGCGFCVEFSHQSEKTKAFIYKPASSSKFEGATIKMVVTTAKLSEYASGNIKNGEGLLTIIFTNNTGLIYQLGN